VLINTNLVIVVSDASIRNNVAISITHIHSYSKPVKKTIHHAINITITKAELFIIKCGINQVAQIKDISYIIVITNSRRSANYIFNPFIYFYQ